ncbi:MAG TPA: hypothetical protein VFE05_22940 [Longimicrobiaceae bacterium]|jgi:hypothetical protein|nr:hypothetical protein [Longimicrobiaceae bacterium]
MVKAVTSDMTGKPFMDDPGRFGLIPDPANPNGLPIGLTDAVTVDTRMLGVHMTGINCSACHVSEVTYRGTRMRVDGGPSNFEADLFRNDLTGSLNTTMHDPMKFLAFIWRLRKEHETANPHLPALVRDESHRLARDIEDLPRAAERDAEAARLLGWARRALEHERGRPAEDILHGLTVSPDPDAPRAPLPRGLTYADAAAAADSLVPDDAVAASSSVLRGAAPGLSPAKHVEAFISDLVLTYRLLKARVAAFRRVLPPADSTTAGWGRVDAFGVARNSIYPQDTVALTAPVSYPWLWGFGNQTWFHYDANTNSFMQRNLGEAIGVGAVYDSATLVSTLNPRNIRRLEVLGRQIQPPSWPEQVFGPIDRAKAQRGSAVFASTCGSCHTNPANDAWNAPASVATDSNRLRNFAKPMNDGRTFTAWVSPFLAGLERNAYHTFRVPADSQAVWSGPQPTVWRTTSRWASRPLAGIWATAPYLHNNSVPTLYDLLQPAAQRPVTFAVGQREYDPSKVGIAAAAQPREVLDTRRSGNRNTGHEFGTNLSADEKSALLEYLKTM